MNLATLVRHALRQFKNSPAFFLIAVAALALGIGANTAIFTAVEALLLRPLPYGEPNRLVMVWEDASFLGFAHNTPAPANFKDWRTENQVFTDMAAFRYRTASLTGDQAPEQITGGAVTPNFFDVLKVQPFLGRPWTEAEDSSKSAAVVISYKLWQRRFGSDPQLVGHNILMNGKSTTVLGVMPRDFFFPFRDMDYWEAGYFTPEQLARRDSHFLTVVARLKPGTKIKSAQLDLNVIAARLAKEHPTSNTNVGAVVVPLQQEFAGDTRAGLWVLQIASVFVLLIACSNLANLLLVRASGRRREIAVRIALGAGRKGIIGQLLAESLLLASTQPIYSRTNGRHGFVPQSDSASFYFGHFNTFGNLFWPGSRSQSYSHLHSRCFERGRPLRRIAPRHAPSGRARGGPVCSCARFTRWSRPDDANHVEFAQG
jgi:putative ABC transport system permease protein